MIPDWMFQPTNLPLEELHARVERAIETSDWSEVIAAQRAEHDRGYRPKVQALIAAGWTFELPESIDDMMCWYWRRPPRRKGKPGRLYRSTDQAYYAMMREMT